MEHSNIYHLIILDESGSMTTIKRQAVGGLNETLGGIRSASREKTDQNHFVSIITDGMENSSEEWSGKAVKALVGRLREKGWTFAYIGANQDAVEVARELDIRNALNFDATPEGTVEMGYVLKESTANFCMMSKASMADNSDFFVKKPGKK